MRDSGRGPSTAPATAADAPEVAQIYVESWHLGFAGLMPPRVLGEDQVARWESDLGNGPVRWRLAEERGRCVGFVGTGPSRDPSDTGLGEVDTIAVLPHAWRKGVGRVLMSAAVEDMVEGGYREAILWTAADHVPTLSFYEATGWHASGEVRDSGRQVAFRRDCGNSSSS